MLGLGVSVALPLGLAQAAPLATRSLSLSSDAKGATGVHYTLSFTAESDNTNAVIVDFCRNSAVVTDTCEPVGGLDVTSVATTGSDQVSRLSGQTVLITLSATANSGDTVTVELTGITNPYDPGVLYARIVTYDSGTQAAAYQPSVPGTHLDDGAVALTIIDGVAVGGSVLESLEFCSSGSVLDGSGCAGTLTPPDLALGGENGLGLELAISSVFTEISTNAATGAVISLKSSAYGCGGLVRREDPSQCDIAPQTTPGPIPSGVARFGMKLGLVENGTGAVVPAGNYSTSDYFLNYVNGGASGVTSAYGDPIYTTSGAPLSGGRAELVFGANRGTNTPAGSYGAELNLLATGKF